MNNQIDDIKLDGEFMKIYEKARPYTMTSIERAYALYGSCKYIINNKISGDFVECGVWKGGSAMIMAFVLKALGEMNRKIYLYDTFNGMSDPENIDVDINNQSAKFLLNITDKKTSDVWSYATENEVKKNLFSTGYDKNFIFFIKGKVEETIPDIMPKEIALLRLDTDWYSSTYHELNSMYPILSKRGVLIIDDYGHWAGARKAVDKYFSEHNYVVLLNRIDYTGRMLIKLGKVQ